MNNIIYRRARPSDTRPILNLINVYSAKGVMLPRPYAQVMDKIRDELQQAIQSQVTAVGEGAGRALLLRVHAPTLTGPARPAEPANRAGALTGCRGRTPACRPDRGRRRSRSGGPGRPAGRRPRRPAGPPGTWARTGRCRLGRFIYLIRARFLRMRGCYSIRRLGTSSRGSGRSLR